MILNQITVLELSSPSLTLCMWFTSIICIFFIISSFFDFLFTLQVLKISMKMVWWPAGTHRYVKPTISLNHNIWG